MARLLLLDDDPETLAWMVPALEARGHVARGFTNAREALAALADWKADLIIADILLPEMDGLRFARLARLHRGVPLMFVSVARKEAEGVLAGALGYVRKPATAAEVRAEVERVLGRADLPATILVVDDEPDVRELCRAVLEPRFRVLEAEHGRAALEVLVRERVDLAIVDVHMPVMNGVELIRAVRLSAALNRLPVIVQTSDVGALHAPVWRDLQVSQLVDKGKFMDWLDRQINEHLSGR